MATTKEAAAGQCIYKFSRYFRRSGSLAGVFTATPKEIAAIIGRSVCFGEVLGKHSEVQATMEDKDFKMVSDDPAFVALFNEHDLATGTNPLSYLDNE